MARSRKSNTVPRHADADQGLNANSVVSYRIRSARERKGYTQQEFARELGKLTGHVLPQSSIGAMERWEGDKQRMFDAHELYLLSLVLDVPIAYFFIPPPGMNTELMRDSRYGVNELPLRLIGTDDEVAALDEAIGEMTGPEDGDLAPGFIAGPPGWFQRFRTWRLQRLRQLEAKYDDQLSPLARQLQELGNDILEYGASGFLTTRALIAGDEYPPRSEEVGDGEAG